MAILQKSSLNIGKIKTYIFVNPIKMALTIRTECNRILLAAVYLRRKEVQRAESPSMERRSS